MSKKQPFIPVSKYYYAGDLLEQIFDKKRKTTCFLRYDKKNEETIKMDKVEEYGKMYIPIVDELLYKEVVLLPSTAKKYDTKEHLEKEIHDFVYHWLDISEDYLQKVVWYVMLTWIIDNLHTIPYLRALGDYGTGKTRYLDVIGGICYKPMFVGGSVRSAPIYRVIDKWRGTSIFDEFTLGKSDETEDIIQILNNGFQRGKPVLRCDIGRSMNVKAFDPFGAKILASRSPFRDKALESRCITEVMKMSNREIPIDLTEKFFKQRQELQNKLLMFRFRNLDILKHNDSLKINFGNILPRIKQSFSPFIVLFKDNEERLKKFLEYTQKYNKIMIEENATSFDGQIFNVYYNMFEEHEENQQSNLDDYNPFLITSSDVRSHMINDGWSEEKLHAATIGKRLKSLGFETHPTKIAGKTKRILKIDDNLLKNLVSRYVVTAVTAKNDSSGINTLVLSGFGDKE